MEKEKVKAEVKVKLEKSHMRREMARYFNESSGFFVTNYSGLSVEKLSELRRAVRTAKCRYFVVKNNIARLVLEERNIKDAAGLLEGPCGFGFVPASPAGGTDDPVAIAKALVAFSKTNEAFKLKGGYLDGAVLSQDMVKELASLPSREVLIAKAIGVIKSPLYKIANVLAGTYRKLVYVLEAIKNKEIPRPSR